MTNKTFLPAIRLNLDFATGPNEGQADVQSPRNGHAGSSRTGHIRIDCSQVLEAELVEEIPIRIAPLNPNLHELSQAIGRIYEYRRLEIIT